MLFINVDAPNNPVSRGKSGWLKSVFKTINPKIPVRVNINRAVNFFCSRKINIPETRIKMKGIIFDIFR